MEKSPRESSRKELPPEELAALRAALREAASDLKGTRARYAENHPEEARQYREATESVIRARREGEKWGEDHYIL